jgi:hypothetical protein
MMPNDNAGSTMGSTSDGSTGSSAKQ